MSREESILVVEDEANERRTLQLVLTEKGYTVEAAGNGREALEKALTKSFNAALVDILLPDMDGSDLLGSLKMRNPEMVVLMITGHATVDNAVRALNEGASAYLTKPLNLDDALSTLRHHLEKQRLELEKEQAEKALRESEAQLREALAQNESLIAAISAVFISVDANGIVTKWNAAAERVLGIASVDAMGRPLAESGLPPDSDLIQALSEALASGTSRRVDEVEFKHPDGTTRVMGVTASPVDGKGPRPSGALLLGRDITALKAIQDQLAQNRKLKAVGRLAAGIAHEINTPTQYVGDNIVFLQESFSLLLNLMARYRQLKEAAREGAVPQELVAEIESLAKEIDDDFLREEIPKAIEQSLQGIERVATIVRAMKDFAHPGPAEKIGLDINRAIESTLTVSRNEWKYVADLITDFDPDLPLVPCIPGQFNEAILNLIVNAAQAVGEAVEQRSNGKGQIAVSTRRAGDWAEIRIRDTGTGIPPEARSRIFDPFFTTKDVGDGTGQGLAIARVAIVEKHGGTIDFETAVGKGTTFTIRLPLGDDSQ